MKRFIITMMTLLLFAAPLFAQGPPVNSRTNRPPSWSHRPPSWNHRPPSWNHRPPTWHHRPPSWGWNHRPPSWGWNSRVWWSSSRPPSLGWQHLHRNAVWGTSFRFSSSSFSSSAVFVQAPPVQTVFVQAPPVQTVFIAEPPARDQIVVVKIGDTIVSRLRPGEAVITPDGLVLENVDGQLVVHRGQ